MAFPPNRPPPIFNDMPPNLTQFRTQLFAMETPLQMPTAEFEALWKYVDNMYVRNSSSQCKNKGTTTTYYYCRLWRKTPYKGPSAEERQRKRSSRTPIGCPCKIKTIEHAGILLIEKSSPETHNHEYSALEFKMPSAIRKIAALEVAKGYKPSEVSKTLRNAKNGNLAALEIAGGANFSAKAVHNATQSWRRSRGAIIEERNPNSPSLKASSDGIGASTRRDLEIRNILDSILSCYNNLEAQTKELPEELQDSILQNWIASLRTQTGFLRSVGGDQLRIARSQETQSALKNK
jgi:hypothetical protein